MIFHINILWCVRLREIVTKYCYQVLRDDIGLKIMRRIKGRSATKIFESYPELRKRYWGRHFWARDYFCVTSGELTQEMIEGYLAHHFEAKVDDNFRNED